MNIFQALGFVWIVFTAAIGHAVVILLAYHQFREMEWHWRRGKAEQFRDACEMSRMRQHLNVNS